MRAVLRLVWTYFAATRLMRGLAAMGIVLTLIGAAGHLLIPNSQIVQALYGGDPSFLAVAVVVAAPWLGLVLLLSATMLMPAMIERIALGRSVWVLPGGRVKLLASVVLTALLLAVLVATQAVISFLDYRLDDVRIFYRTLLMAFIDFGMIYTAIWLIAKTNGVWRLVGMLWVIISLFIPLRYIGRIPPLSWFEVIGMASWAVFGALLLAGGRFRHAFHALKAAVTGLARRASPPVPYQTGRELDLVLGITRPWLVALGQIVPIAVMVVTNRESSIWLVILIVFSAIAGAITSQAASRARRLWLRYGWSREEIVHHVEWAFWRYNVWSLAVLLVLYLGLAIYADVPRTLLGHGVLLLVLGCVTCTYLGLMITRGLGWFESCLCILTLLALVVAAIALVWQAFRVAIELEILLAVLAMAYRYMALARWAALDWMRCRPEVLARSAG